MSMGIFLSFSTLYFIFFVEVYTRVLWKLAIIQIARRKRGRKVEIILSELVIGSVTYSIIEFDNLSLFFSKSHIETARMES